VFAWRAYKRLVEQMNEREERLVGVLDRLDVTLERNSRVIEDNSAVHARVIAAIDDMRDEIRANTQAILRMLDRLDGGEQPA
jgi:hypothetical protein